MPAKPKAEPKFTFEETEFGFEIGLKSGARRRVMLFCKVGEGFTEFPAGTALLSQMSGGDKGCRVRAPIPLDAHLARPCQCAATQYAKAKTGHSQILARIFYWLHPVDYDAGRCGCLQNETRAHVPGRKTSVGVARSGGDNRQGERRGSLTRRSFTVIMTFAFALSITTASRKRSTYTGTASWN